METKSTKILISGGSLGIGKETARLLVKEGADVIITGRDRARLEKAASDTGAIPFVADVADENDVQSTFNFIMEKWARLDCLINNAGIGGESNLLINTNLEDFNQVYSVNVFGAAMMAKYASRIFKDQQYGNIVNVSSTASLRGYEKATVYASSKFALRGMTACWQAELRKYNIRVMLINPSEVTTAFGSTERIERKERPNRLRSQEVAHAIISSLKMDDRGFIPELTIYATNPW